MAIEHSGMSITTDAIKSKLLDMEPEHKEVDGAFAAFQKYQHKKNGKSMVKGNHDGGQMSKSNVTVNKQIKCYKCKQVFIFEISAQK